MLPTTLKLSADAVPFLDRLDRGQGYDYAQDFGDGSTATEDYPQRRDAENTDYR